MEINQEQYQSLLKEVTLSDPDALGYLMVMSRIFRLWDDLYDQDAEITQESINDVFTALNFDLSKNRFFHAHRDVLEAFVFLAWNAWMDSNTWQGSPDKMKGICAWFIRDWCNEIDVLVAWLVGGTEHARRISLKCREFYLTQLVARGVDGFFRD